MKGSTNSGIVAQDGDDTYDFSHPGNYPHCDPHEPFDLDAFLDPNFDPMLVEPCYRFDIDGKPFFEDYIELVK